MIARLLARLVRGLDGVECPNCGRQMRELEVEVYECRCGAVADPGRGGWRFGAETRYRQLPGVLGARWRG